MGKSKNKKPDYFLLSVSLLIILLGIIVFVSVSMARMATSEVDADQIDFFYFLTRQFLTGLLPFSVVGYLMYKIPIDKIRKAAPILLFFSLILVALTFIPGLGVTTRGARRWLRVGSITFQASEVLKLTFIIYLASWLSGRKTKRRRKEIFSETLLVFIFLCGLVSSLLLLQPDFSTLMVIVLTGSVMYFTYRTPLSHILTIGVFGLISSVFMVIISPYRLQRIRDAINPGFDIQGVSYQAHQAMIAIGSGGIFGLGFGMSNQKYGFLPFSMSDSIFAAYAEEAGFVGALILVTLFLLFFWRGLKIAKNCRSDFESLLVTGISFWIFFQAFVHMGSMTGILPITGIPLPFISYGRAHLLAEMSALGLLLNISKK